jgi:hypothetical protein
MPRHLTILAVLVAAMLASASRHAQADDWGNLKGRFLYEGKAPEPTKLTIDKDPQVCGDKGLVAEDLVVDSGGGLANVMIYVRGKVKVHPEFDKTADATVVLDNKGCRFNPHVLGIRVGQTLQIKSSDPISHNTNVTGKNLQFNQLITPGNPFDTKIEAAETLPALVACNIHPWMKGRLLIRSNPYFAVSAKDGTFEIKKLPAGELGFIVFHERSGFVKDVEMKGSKTTWPATVGEVAKEGSLKVTIEPGKDTDLGDIKLAAPQFNKD